MKVLVVGQGGREHALVKALLESAHVKKIIVCPGSAGIELGSKQFNKNNVEIVCYPKIKSSDSQNIVNLSLNEKVDLVIIGPEDPLVFGLADELRAHQINVFGPSKNAAQLEGSKLRAKQFMFQHGVKTSRFHKVTSLLEIQSVINEYSPPYVLKADGLCAGKGVFICKSLEELYFNANLLFTKKIFAQAGEVAVLEEFLPGYEMSVFVLTNGEQYEILPIAQDHKQLYNDDQGPNTGGMGTVAPVTISKTLMTKIKESIILPTLVGLKKENLFYRGVIFIGLMISNDEPYCLEYNCRWGDPETQVILPLLEGDWAQIFYQIAQGNMPASLKWQKLFACCVVLAAKGYPENPLKGLIIESSLNSSADLKSYFLHAGTKVNKNFWECQGGRVLNVVSSSTTLIDAVQQSYELVKNTDTKNLIYRDDIGKKLLKIIS